MTDPFVAEIRIFGFHFPPKGWAFCDGQLMAISQNTALFSLLGTAFGGDGRSTFGLPNLQDRVPVFYGQARSGTNYDVGQTGGEPTVTLQTTEIPAHNHTVNAILEQANERQPPSQTFAVGDSVGFYEENSVPATATAPGNLTATGASVPHNNMMPYLTFNFCIALQGIFPPRG